MRAGGPPPPPEPEYDQGVFQQDEQGAAIRPAGLREPQGIVSLGDQEGRFDDVVGWGFSLVLRGEDPLSQLSADQRAFLQDIGCHAVQLGGDAEGALTELDTEYERWFSEHGVIGYLGRPDFRVFAGIRSADEVPGIVDELAAQLSAGVKVAVS